MTRKFLFVAYITTLSLTQDILRQMYEYYELGGTWKEAVVVRFKVLSE
jgi:hypothetical protein